MDIINTLQYYSCTFHSRKANYYIFLPNTCNILCT
uniref:Uncharacterized protein n=1 Tax=Anguilla anguilla TaxID=7936 RepID=A0A0E9VJP7_ANGAN